MMARILITSEYDDRAALSTAFPTLIVDDVRFSIPPQNNNIKRYDVAGRYEPHDIHDVSRISATVE